MKQKWRYIFVLAALFVIIVSYKILEPELFRNRDSGFNRITAAEGSYKDGVNDNIKNRHEDESEDKALQLSRDHPDGHVVDEIKEAVPQHVNVDEVRVTL